MTLVAPGRATLNLLCLVPKDSLSAFLTSVASKTAEDDELHRCLRRDHFEALDGSAEVAGNTRRSKRASGKDPVGTTREPIEKPKSALDCIGPVPFLKAVQAGTVTRAIRGSGSNSTAPKHLLK